SGSINSSSNNDLLFPEVDAALAFGGLTSLDVARSLIEAALSDPGAGFFAGRRLATPRTSSSSRGARLRSSSTPGPLPVSSSFLVSRSDPEVVRPLPDGDLPEPAVPDDGVGIPSAKRVKTPLPTPGSPLSRDSSVLPPIDRPRSASHSLSVEATSPAVCGRSIGFLAIIASHISTSDGGASGRAL